jgi:hypothetical protein
MVNNEFEVINDIVVIKIKHKNGNIIKTTISKSDFEKANEYPGAWMAKWDNHTQSYYVYGKLYLGDGKYKQVYLHRWITNCPKGYVVDHIDRDTLNNRSENLRIATISQNAQNRKEVQVNNTSGIRGVYRCKKSGKWIARITVNYKKIHIGKFDNLFDAEQAVKEARAKYMPYSQEANGDKKIV